MNLNNKLKYTAWGLWGCLGMYRGHKYYVNKHNKRQKYNPYENYYYITDTFISIWTGAIYLFPPTMCVSGIYELYKLEETIRGIDTNDDW